MDSKGQEGQIGKKSPKLRRQLPTVTGKELKINPRTGHIKKKPNVHRQDENSNDTTPVDKQPMVIVNENSTG